MLKLVSPLLVTTYRIAGIYFPDKRQDIRMVEDAIRE
jgi:hypothetical protein